MAWTFQIVDDWEEVWSEAHLARWQHHMDAADGAHVFFHPALVRAWVDTYRPLRCLQPLFVWAKHEKGMTAILPLTLWRRNWKNAFMKSIVPMGYSDFDYHDPVFSQQPMREDVQGFWAELRGQLCRLYSFDELCLDGLHEEYLPDFGHREGKDTCPFVDLQPYGTLEDCLAGRSKKSRYNLQRQKRINGEKFAVTSRTFDASSIADAVLTMGQMLEFHRKRWPNAYKAPHFHENVVRHGLGAGVVHFSTVSFDEEVVSWQLNFIYKNRYYAYMPTLHDGYSSFSPGRLHLVDCIGSAIDAGCRCYDFLRGDEAYKGEWAKESQHVYDVRIQPTHRSLIGAGKRCLLAIRNKIFK